VTLRTIHPTPAEHGAVSIDEFCNAHDLSRATFYRGIKAGHMPASIKVGRRHLIPRRAIAEWHAKLGSPVNGVDALTASINLPGYPDPLSVTGGAAQIHELIELVSQLGARQ
jgi:excisionase family DNA binding protein